MEGGFNSPTPVPLPRSRSPQPHINLGGKKPVPLPRKTLLESKNMLPCDDTKKTIESKIKSNGFKEDSLTKGYNTLTKSLKNELKSASDSVQEKSKAVIESTKNVSARFEKSVRGILTRRPSTTCSSSPSPKENANKLERCQSLPVEEIFHSISFDSPLVDDKGRLQREAQNSDSDFEDNVPPPSFPPPPLPDESLYDEVQSVRSTISGGHSYENYNLPSLSSSHSECGSYYEELPSFKTLNMLEYSSESEKSLGNETLKDVKKNCQRSGSWSFYDSVDIIQRPKSEPYENVVLRDDIKFNSVNNIYTQCPSTAATANSDPGTLTNRSSVNTLDIEGSLTCGSDVTDSCASRPPSTISSVSVTNELYDNWDPISRLKENAQEKQRRLLPSKSVIIEFDPLYENVVYSALEESENAPKEFNEDTDTFLHSPRYSIIESGPESEEDEVCPSSLPAVPERVDSISQSSISGSVKNIPNDVEYYLYHRTKDKNSGNVEITPKFPTPENLNSSTFYDTVPIEEDVGEHTPGSVTPSESSDRDGSPGKRRPSQLVRWTSMKRAIKAVTDSSNWSPGVIRRMSRSVAASKISLVEDEPQKQDLLQRPQPDLSNSRIHGSFVFRSLSGGERSKDFVQRWCHLGEGKLSFNSEKGGANNKDYISLDSISSISTVRDVKTSGDNEDVYCMEVSVIPRGRVFLIGSPGTTERRIWMQKILESMTATFPPRITSDYTRAGWCYLKEGVSGEWMASWILLRNRLLHYSQPTCKVKALDLRKARSVVLKDSDNDNGCSRASEEGPFILVDTPDQTLYLQMDAVRETKAWRQNIRAAAIDNGPNLSDQQLSRNDVPIIVEKCVNFVYAHGLMSEGIYRRCGANSSVSKLLTLFQTDAWAVQLSRQEYTEYDVGNVMKRFFRDLPEPLFTSQLHTHLCNTVALNCTEEEKLSVYRTRLEQLPLVNYLTVRLLLSHLYALHQQRERNLMPADNLASIWAPTLMHVENANVSCDVNYSKREIEVVCELITLYPKLFMVDSEEIDRERRMQEVLEKYHNSRAQQHTQLAPPAGDFKIWVYIGTNDTANCVQISVGPQLTASQVCKMLCYKLNASANTLCLTEMVLDGSLQRPMHHSERVLDSVLRWGYWDDQDCKNNCLILTPNTVYEEISPLIKQSVPKSGELKFADRKSKAFKTYVFEFSQAILSYYKDKAGAQKLGEWRIEDIIWYFGHEPKRNPNMRWSITFIEKQERAKRSKECPYFGHTIAGTSREEQLKWIAAMLIGQFPHSELIPSVNLLE